MNIFLSASVPLPGRDARFIETADVVAIREAIKALVLVALERNAHITFGGHPAITPLIRKMMADTGRNVRDHFTLYLSKYFESTFPLDVNAFEDIVLVDRVEEDREASLTRMRDRMIRGTRYHCGVFIGGMEGVVTEFIMFRNIHPASLALPVASTGAAAAQVYQNEMPAALKTQLTYPTLFRQMLPQ